MTPTDAEYEALKELLEADGQTERECSEYLKYATDWLLGQTPVRLLDLVPEHRNPYGRSDYLIVADLKSGVGQTERCLVFFELKAPQAYLMQEDRMARRYGPSPDLVRAETQLMHYVQQARGDEDLKQRWQVTLRENIRYGGIIIGRDGHIVRGGDNTAQEDALHSFGMRRELFYVPNHIRIETWDRVLCYLEPPKKPDGQGDAA